MESLSGAARYPKAEQIERELMLEIASGKHGVSGTPFMTTRDLMSYKSISLKTAHRILGRLCGSGVLEVQGKRYYLTGSSQVSGGLTIGVLLTQLNTAYFSNLASCLEEIIRELGAEISLTVSDYNSDLERCRLENFCRSGVSGIIACPWGLEENRELYRHLPVPCVLLGRQFQDSSFDAILVDNEKAARGVASHLVSLGCEDFLYVGPENLRDDPRLLGYRLGLLEAGKSLASSDVLYVTSSSGEMESVRSRLLSCRRKTGVFCYHDLYAARVIGLCHEEKLSIPGQVAVVGFDNLPTAAAIYPSLTSVGYPVRSIAQMACEILFTKIRCRTLVGGTTRYLDSQLIIRKSTVGSSVQGSASAVPQHNV